MQIYTIRDNKAEHCNTPFFQKSDVQALRAFKAEVNRAADNNMMYLYPDDWDLVHIGSYDETSGTIDTKTAKGKLANGKAHQVEK